MSAGSFKLKTKTDRKEVRDRFSHRTARARAHVHVKTDKVGKRIVRQGRAGQGVQYHEDPTPLPPPPLSSTLFEFVSGTFLVRIALWYGLAHDQLQAQQTSVPRRQTCPESHRHRLARAHLPCIHIFMCMNVCIRAYTCE